MAGANTPRVEPETIVAGDTVEWYRDIDDYPASEGWTLSYALVNSSGKIDITAGADGDAHLVSVDTSTSANFSAGDYRWQAYVTGSGKRYLVGTGRITVKANYATQTAGLDDRSHAETTLDALRATIEGRASNDQLEMQINGRRIVRMGGAELREWYSFYENQVKSERAAEKAARGLGTGRRILTRFNN